jgi:hypothetical protein
MRLLEPATTLTDYLLALECGWFAWVLLRRSRASLLRAAFVALFASVAGAAVFGGTVHGFFPDPDGMPSRLLWSATMLSIGVTAAAMCAVGAAVASGAEKARKLLPALALGLAAYLGVVLFVSREFVVAIIAYLPAAFFLLAVFAWKWSVDRSRWAVSGILGVVLALVGALVQQWGVALHPVHFDHNAVYHLIQAVALYLLFRVALAVCGADSTP